jgi:hypothetical protein
VPNPTDLLNLVQAGGVIAFALLVIYGFLTERIVPAGRLKDVQEQLRDALDAGRAALGSMDRLSEAVEARNRLEEERLREERLRNEIIRGRGE